MIIPANNDTIIRSVTGGIFNRVNCKLLCKQAVIHTICVILPVNKEWQASPLDTAALFMQLLFLLVCVKRELATQISTNGSLFHCCGSYIPAALEPQCDPLVHRLVDAGKVNASFLGDQKQVYESREVATS